MAEPRYVGTPGVEVQLSDMQSIGKVAGLADDRALAELLRLQPFDGTHYTKMILPYGWSFTPPPSGAAATANSGPTVQTGAPTPGGVVVFPFRAVVGSRTTMAAGAELDNWRDIRSGVFQGGAGAGFATVPLAANASGNPRWDLVYASVAVDTVTSPLLRRIKGPSTSQVSVSAVQASLTQVVTVAVVQGTPAGTPTLPFPPADSPLATPAVFNIPLAYVAVKNGFNSSQLVSNAQIRDAVRTYGLGIESTGLQRIRPASGNNDGSGTYTTNFPWVASATSPRPPLFLPPSMIGGESLFVEMDLTSNGTPSHPDKGIVDNSIDWRSRFFMTFACATNTAPFANDPGVGGLGSPIPAPPLAGIAGQDWGMGQSHFPDNALGADVNAATVFYTNSARIGGGFLGGGSTVGLYVEVTSGILRAHWSGTPAGKVFFWVMASAPFGNR